MRTAVPLEGQLREAKVNQSICMTTKTLGKNGVPRAALSPA